MAKRVDVYYSERSAFYLVKSASIQNSVWFNDALQPAYVADCYNACAYYEEKGKLVGFKFPGKAPAEFKSKKELGCYVPRERTEASVLLREISTDFNIFGFKGLHRFDIKFIENYENIMREQDEVVRNKRLDENTKISTIEVFRAEKNKANRTYGLYRSPFCVGFYVPDIERAQQDLVKAYAKNVSAMPLNLPDLSDIAIRVPAPLFPMLMALESGYHLQEDGTVLEFPDHAYTTREAFLEHIVQQVTASGNLPEPQKSDLPELTLWMPEVV